ncbi:unnamed protein product [Brachionus calyciflorus]|uniref:Uncharacterized protein n=1 Tax=Brachionus calyciflorus TaxID=104777 RepID=A0A813ZMH2_9BILA|nr:unnamed protein product [Brachionus calyciflorus]
MFAEIVIYGIFLSIIFYLANRFYFSGARYESNKQLNGKIAIVTGANSGIGYETALDFAKRGAHVILACRDTVKAEKSVEIIRRQTGNEKVDYEIIDLADLNSVKSFCGKIKSKFDRLDILVNNAGVMGCPTTWRTKQGYEMHFGVNYLGHFLLTNLLLDLIKKTPQSRIVSLSSCIHYIAKMYWNSFNGGINIMKGYSQSKLVIILFTKELTKRLDGSGVTCVCLNPGVVRTDILRYTAKSVCFLFPIIVNLLYLLYMVFTKSPFEGALTTIYCAIDDEVPKYNGYYFSDCNIKKPSKAALNEQDAKRLWDISVEMIDPKVYQYSN